MFHRTYPEAKISAATLRRVFMRHRIRHKMIKKVKRHINFKCDPYRSNIISLINEITELQKGGVRILYLDEAIFSFNTFTGKAWAHAK
jgi:hypothetical protein